MNNRYEYHLPLRRLYPTKSLKNGYIFNHIQITGIFYKTVHRHIAIKNPCLSLDTLRWLVIIVVVYTSVVMLWAGFSKQKPPLSIWSRIAERKKPCKSMIYKAF